MIRRTLSGAALLGLLAFGGEVQAQAGAPELVVADTDVPVWYIGRQLRNPVRLEVRGATERTCPNTQVTATVSGQGLVSPQNAPGVWEDGRCIASISWTLSNEIGRQHLSATVAGSNNEPLIVEAKGRQGARVFFGAAYTPREEGHTTLGSAPDGTPAVDAVDPRAVFRPIMGVDFAPWPEWDRVRMAVATGARDFDRQFFFGFSVLQAFVFGQPSEGATVDVHAGIQLTRRDIAITGPQCGAAPACEDSDLRFSGLTFFLGIDGASAFRGLAGTILR